MKNKKRKQYRDLHWLDKGLDILLAGGIIVGIILLALEFSSDYKFGSWVGVVDVALIGIFLADSFRSFLKSRGFFDYLKHHWLDLVILGVAMISFSSIFFVGAGRLSWLAREERILKVLSRIK